LRISSYSYLDYLGLRNGKHKACLCLVWLHSNNIIDRSVSAFWWDVLSANSVTVKLVPGASRYTTRSSLYEKGATIRTSPNYRPSFNARFSFFVGDALRLELKGVIGMSNCRFKLDVVIELCDCLLLAGLAGRFCQNGESAALIDVRRSPIAKSM
jgi:hypothetical protein